VNGLLEGVLGLASPWAYVVVAVLAGLEAAAFIGQVIPGEAAMLLGGVLAFFRPGQPGGDDDLRRGPPRQWDGRNRVVGGRSGGRGRHRPRHCERRVPTAGCSQGVIAALVVRSWSGVVWMPETALSPVEIDEVWRRWR